MTPLEKELSHPLNRRMLSCPIQDKWTSFQLADEFGSGEAYAGLSYVITDCEGQQYRGKLDAVGVGKVERHFSGPTALMFDQKYLGSEKVYVELMRRDSYPLEITELQVRAEHTRHLNHNSTRTRVNPATDCADEYFQVEVRHLVEHVSHLPPEVYRHFPHRTGTAKLMRGHGKYGVALMQGKHTVLEVRPLRALRPMLSTSPEFCALNLYQLALMATLSYCPFGQQPSTQPVEEDSVSFPLQPSVGNWFGDALAKSDEIWRVDSGQTKAYYPLYEEVPYSDRLEIIPFDPLLYGENNPALGEDQENPANLHFFDDTILGVGSTDTQAFITHNDQLILISVRGTSSVADGVRDGDAFQVPFEEGAGRVHRGFYQAAKKAYGFVVRYLDKFYAGQTLIICGHSLGGAIALLLAEMLRSRPEAYTLQLYTYGAPRAADSTFVKAAAPLVHYRMVNHNDPVPSVPGTWMNTKVDVYATGLALTFVNVPLGLSVFVAGISNVSGEPYEHHGTLRHLLPVEFGRGEKSTILWAPGCDTIIQHAACTMAIAQRNGLPNRPGLITQSLNSPDHFMSNYVPGCWATLRRWQEAEQAEDSLVSKREFELIEVALMNITRRLHHEEDRFANSPDKRKSTHQHIPQALEDERHKIETTYQRLKSLRFKTVRAEHVYGSLAQQPERLATSLARWQAHPENRVVEQLAMAPEPEDDDWMASIYGLPPKGTPFDIDSMS